jgi:hypothetical protein
MSVRLAALVVVATVMMTGHARAQSAPRADIYAGYSLLPGDPIDDFPRVTASHGIHVSAAIHPTSWFGLAADLGMQFGTHRDLGLNFEGLVARTRVTEFLAAPRFTARGEQADVFAHGLFGLASGDAGEDFSGFTDTKMAFGGGAGVDVHISPRWSVRAQFDLLGSFADIVEGNSRLAVGLVYRLVRD